MKLTLMQRAILRDLWKTEPELEIPFLARHNPRTVTSLVDRGLIEARQHVQFGAFLWSLTPAGRRVIGRWIGDER